jgi:hypothetical protein
MDETTLDPHRCHNDRCRRSFIVVCRQSWHDVPIPAAMACPHCGHWDIVLVPTGAVRQTEGAWVLPLDHREAALAP